MSLLCLTLEQNGKSAATLPHTTPPKWLLLGSSDPPAGHRLWGFNRCIVGWMLSVGLADGRYQHVRVCVVLAPQRDKTTNACISAAVLRTFSIGE